MDIPGGRPWINAKRSSVIISSELIGRQSLPAVGDIMMCQPAMTIADYCKQDSNNKNSQQ